MIENFGYVMATKMLVDTKLRVGYMYREAPDNANDSGWRMFVGNETIEYVNNPENIGIYDVNTVVNIDSAIVSLLHNNVGTSFVRINKDTFMQEDKEQ